MTLAAKEDKYLIKYLAFIDHFERLKKCKDCKLRSLGQHQCPGLGNLFNSKIMFIGEAPGKVKNPELRGLPFVGNRSSNLLLEIIYELWPNGYDDVYITNIVKCNPPDNRTPTKEEIETCSKWLKEEVKLVNPKVIVALGRTVANWFEVEESINTAQYKEYLWEGIKLFVLYHPAYIIRFNIIKEKVTNQYKNQFRKIKKILDGLK